MLKALVRKADDAVLGGALSRLRQRLVDAGDLRAWQRESDNGTRYQCVVNYRKGEADLLWRLCDKYGSDKAEATTLYPSPDVSHTYADFYARLFSHCRDHIKSVFECGLGTNNNQFVSNMGASGRPGASLRVWRDYFPNAAVVGADIDRSVLFEEDRIRTFYVDQLDPRAIAALWQAAGTADFDLMIDDGLHEYEAGRCLFEHSIARLAPHGIYIIEDVKLRDLSRYRSYFAGKPYVVDYVNLFRPSVELSDNNMVVIRRPE